MNENIKQFSDKMTKSISTLESDLASVRVGRANPRILDKISIDYYGVPTPLNQVANVKVPEAKVIVIQPYDTSVLKLIEKAIQTSDLGLNPNNDGKSIRLVFPDLTEERRLELSKDVKKKGEDAKIAIRNIRRDAMDFFKKQEKAATITEDDLKLIETEIQKLTDKKIEEIDKVIAEKSKEIMSI